MLGNDSDNGLLGGIIILLTTGSVLSVLVVLVVWKKFWLRAADHEDDNDSEGGNRTALCSCCNSHDNSSVTPGTVYRDENSGLLRKLLGNKFNSGSRVKATTTIASTTYRAPNPLPSQSYYPPVPTSTQDNSPDLVYDVPDVSYSANDDASSPRHTERTLDQRTASSSSYAYATVSYHDDNQIYTEVNERRDNPGSKRSQQTETQVHYEFGSPQELDADGSVNLRKTAKSKPQMYYDFGHPQEMETGEPGKQRYTGKKPKPRPPQNMFYSYTDVARPARVATNTSTKEYTEPARDEQSLYSQFKSLKLNLVKKSAVKLGDYLGSGQFGTVFSGEWNSGGRKIEVAVKTLSANPHIDDKVMFLQEAVIMCQFRHKNVIKMHGLVTDEEPFMIILELLSRGDLRKHLIAMRPHGGVDSDLPQELLRYCRQIAFGMNYLSKIGFIHRDLAARNILIAEDRTCKIADFGMSRNLANEDYYISHGGQIPVKWTAPEAMNFRKYSTASDVWSFGVVMYEIWSLGHKPFENYTNNEALQLVNEGIRLAPPPGCPKAIYSLMIKCWNPLPSERPLFEDAVKYLVTDEDKLLKWSVREKAMHLSACHLGADLQVAENLHQDLRNLYIR